MSGSVHTAATMATGVCVASAMVAGVCVADATSERVHVAGATSAEKCNTSRFAALHPTSGFGFGPPGLFCSVYQYISRGGLCGDGVRDAGTLSGKDATAG